jgi:NAD-dependent deacetylase
MDELVRHAADLLAASRRVVVFTGAGVSTESGIPDFRGPAAHQAIAALDALGLLDCVITQNIDNLHQRAGLPPEKVIELHGNATRVRCLGCGADSTRDEVQARLEAGEAVPDCRGCGGILKPHTILFGEAMPVRETRLAEERARTAGCFVVAGSSLAVYPAAYMPIYAREGGARLVIVNLEPTPLDDQADVVIPGKAGEVMARLVAAVGERVAPRGPR